MRETIFRLRRLADRYKFVFAVAGLFFSGALLGMGYSSWHTDKSLSRQHKAYERQIARLDADLAQERGVNREKLEVLAQEMDEISDAVGRLLTVAEEASQTARSAATAARTAATTAQGAAKNAAQANIKITEVKPDKDLRLE